MNDELGKQKLLDKYQQLEQQLKRIKLNFTSFAEQESALQQEANKMSLLVSPEEELLARYQVNLEAFKNYYPDIYNFYLDFEPKKYALNIQDGFVNAVDVKAARNFYEYPAFLTTKLQFDQFLHSDMLKKFHFNESVENEAKFSHVDCLDNIQALNHPKKQPFSFDKRKHLCSMIIFGVAAGYHLEMIAQKFVSQCLYIIEPDIELFYLSLFCINWQHILETIDKKNGRIYISIGEQKDTFFDECMDMSAISGRYQMSHIAGYIHYISDEMDEIIKEFNRRYFEMGQGWGFFDDGVIAIAHMLGNFKDNVPIISKDAQFKTNCQEKPVFIVGNGPSLDDLIGLIESYQDKAIIISCGSALSALYEYGIKPDFHCEQERTFPVAEKIDHYCPKEFLENIILFAPMNVHPEVFNKFERKFMAAKSNEPSTAMLMATESAQKYYDAYLYINPTVANTALCLGYALGFKEFYFMGVDLGHKRGGSHHSINSLYYSKDNEDKGLYKIAEGKETELDGNLGGKFICDDFFYTSNLSLSRMIMSNEDLNCFNLSDGSLIKGARPLLPEEFSQQFSKLSAFNKPELVQDVFETATIDDNHQLYQELVNNLAFDDFDEICQQLILLSQKPIETFDDAINYLMDNTKVLRASKGHVHDLLVGTLMHVQVTLNHLLYGGKSEEDGLAVFKQGISYFNDFLAIAPQYYRENALTSHYSDSKWIRKLAESSK
ncbi:hypothetical protein tinsulaeT_09850 [Thalassotalea insulae]|uniref:Motility associated factor glycosyltransferase family protein n=2 Tax=Thalassotalea insulae TaxID=2056778 RepID=A0ABQ6GSI7_9GAMM|nr:hypothetical protein tinsulaeT_09850 [Thalassotalea insulae]